MHVDLPLDIKAVENEEWATGPPSLRAAGPPGRRGPWAAGRWAFGPPGRWAVAGRGPLGRGPAFSKTPRTRTYSHLLEAKVPNQSHSKCTYGTVYKVKTSKLENTKDYDSSRAFIAKP